VVLLGFTPDSCAKGIENVVTFFQLGTPEMIIITMFKTPKVQDFPKRRGRQIDAWFFSTPRAHGRLTQVVNGCTPQAESIRKLFSGVLDRLFSTSL